MRLPHYLYLAPSGVWHFRQRLPAHLTSVCGRAFIKASLHTRDTQEAQWRALELARRYALVFGWLRSGAVAGEPDIKEVLRRLAQGQGRDYKIRRASDGTFEMEANGPDDHKLAMQALEQIGRKDHLFPAPVAASAPVASPPRPKTADIPIGKAVETWLREIEPNTKPKTLTIKRSAVEGFAKHFGESKLVSDVHRVDVGNWVGALSAGGLQTPTLVNKCSYLRGFFDWAKGRGYFADDNPSVGQVAYGTRAKRVRRAHGFKAFSTEQIRALFSDTALEALSDDQRWGALIGLHTGARVSEVGQLRLDDIADVEGVPCFRITDEGSGQSVKTSASLRTIPIHPKLIELGLLKHVEQLRKAGVTKLFPKAKADAVNGPGQWLSKVFSRHIERHLKKPEKGKYGFHSLRKTVVQRLQDLGIEAEFRAAYVGHELDDEHHAAYSRPPTMPELLEKISGLDFIKTRKVGA